MYVYPSLTSAQQADLPQLIAATKHMPAKFYDSTHQLYLCDTVAGKMVLKVCNQAVVERSGFWRGVNHLFGADFPASLGQAQRTRALLINKGLLTVPEVVAAQANGFVLSRFLDGIDADSQVSDAMVVQLAKHIAQLHQHRHEKWGYLHAPNGAPNHWAGRLQASLQLMAAQSALTIPSTVLNTILAQAGDINEIDFVAMMPDFRWDQLRVLADGETLALIDIDAFVIGPRALELVVLEYVLTPAQFALFKTTYSAINTWPDYQAQKPCYQLLLFLMNILGETDFDQWMQRV